jgi:membrane-bound ClpP family serine protease
VTLAAHVAAMAPGTTIGAAHPVSLTAEPQAERSDGEDRELRRR